MAKFDGRNCLAKRPQKTNTSCSMRENDWNAEVNSKRSTKERNKEDIERNEKKRSSGFIKKLIN